MTLEYARPERIGLKGHPEFDELWLQDRIAEDPTILGLGDLIVIDRERRQERAGRLDLLLGATDASHVVRTLEYWDIERRRYPAYEHVAVLVADDVIGHQHRHVLVGRVAAPLDVPVLECADDVAGIGRA